MAHLEDVDIWAMLRLEADATRQSLDEFIGFIRRHYGLTNVAYLCPSFHGRSIMDPFVNMTYSDEWVAHYRAQEYMTVDPVVNIGARSLFLIDWARLPRVDEKVRRLFDEAKEFGVGHQGLTIPVRGPTNGIWALFVATSDDSDLDWNARRRDLMKDFVHIAHYVHQRAYDLHVEERPVDLNAITAREIEALEWSAEGKTSAEIAILMRISVEMVKTHLDSACSKLKALNRVHAVTKAIRAGLIR